MSHKKLSLNMFKTKKIKFRLLMRFVMGTDFIFSFKFFPETAEKNILSYFTI